jgi:hypothetical protein
MFSIMKHASLLCQTVNELQQSFIEWSLATLLSTYFNHHEKNVGARSFDQLAIFPTTKEQLVY